MNMIEPKITIITVCFNEIMNIEKTIESIVEQTYKNIEYIIIDGGSNDGTIDIIRKYEKYISYWKSEKDFGIYDAMNKGIKVASGEYVIFINSGDILHEDIVRVVADKKCFNKADIIYGDIIINNKYVKADSLNEFYYRMPFCHQAVFAKLSLFYEYGLFDLSYKVCADYKWLLNCYLNGKKFFYIEKCIAICKGNGFSVIHEQQIPDENYRALREVIISSVVYDKNNQILKKAKEKNMIAHFRYEMIESDKLFIDILKKKYKDNVSEVIIWGTGEWGNLIYSSCSSEYVVNSFIDTYKKNTEIDGIKVCTPEVLNGYEGYLIIATSKYEDEILKKVYESNFDKTKIICLSDIAAYYFENKTAFY